MATLVRLFPLAIAIASVAVVTGDTHALLSPADADCQDTIATEGLRLLKGRLVIERRCRQKDLRRPGAGACASSRVVRKRAALIEHLEAGVASRCSFGVDLARLGFPGPCADPEPEDGFTATDLTECLVGAADRVLFGLCTGGRNDGEACYVQDDCRDSGSNTSCVGVIPSQYDPTMTTPLMRAAFECQHAIGSAMSNFFVTLLEAVERCRRDFLRCRVGVEGMPSCTLANFEPAACAVSDPDTLETIEKARERARVKIEHACPDPMVLAAIHPCEPDQTTVTNTIDCELAVHTQLAERFRRIQFPGTPVCGNGRIDAPAEECDGTDDAGCPGRCGSSGSLACLCTDRPRMLVIEGAHADLDLGWSGGWHDARLVDGGGYVADLMDCDGPAGLDTVCAVGPSCSLPPHAPCSPLAGQATTGDSMCPGAGNYCRTTAGSAIGPHCTIDFKRRCGTDAACPLAGDRCRTLAHGAPLPLAAGGVSVCVLARFSEDVTGTTDLASGAGSVRMREQVTTMLGGSLAEPCPVCGGFCAGPASLYGPGTRDLCASDVDCPGSHCVTEPVCSYGPRVDQPCRTEPAVGGPTELFGTTSADCPPSPSPLQTLDLLFDPLATVTTQLPATVPCMEPAARGDACVGGPNAGRSCADTAECPGGACRPQCFCPGQQRPNACDAACVGGSNDAAACTSDADCDPPSGFCHPADCRPDPADTDSVQEGKCTIGPLHYACSVHRFVACDADDDCRSPACPFCGPAETCGIRPTACFVNGEIVRAGAAGVPGRVEAGVSCLASTGSVVLDAIIGLPGPVAITQPETVLPIGF